MIYTDMKFIATDSPENDYQQLRDYMAKFPIRRKRIYYRADGVLYTKVRASMRLQLRLDGIYIVKSRAFDKYLNQQADTLERAIVNFRRLGKGPLLKHVFYHICKPHKMDLKRRYNLIDVRINKDQVVLSYETTDIKRSRTAVLTLTQDEPLGMFYIKNNLTEEIRYFDILEEEKQKIKEKITYLHKR